MLNLDELARVAREALQEPWHALPEATSQGIDLSVTSESGHCLAVIPALNGEDAEGEEDAEREPFDVPNHRHMATFDPPTVLAMIARIEALEAAGREVIAGWEANTLWEDGTLAALEALVFPESPQEESDADENLAP